MQVRCMKGGKSSRQRVFFQTARRGTEMGREPLGGRKWVRETGSVSPHGRSAKWLVAKCNHVLRFACLCLVQCKGLPTIIKSAFQEADHSFQPGFKIEEVTDAVEIARSRAQHERPAQHGVLG